MLKLRLVLEMVRVGRLLVVWRCGRRREDRRRLNWKSMFLVVTRASLITDRQRRNLSSSRLMELRWLDARDWSVVRRSCLELGSRSGGLFGDC